MRAYVQISLDSAREKEVQDKLTDMKEVIDVHILFGEWDMMAKIEVASAEALGPFIMNNIRAIKGVKLTNTMIVAK